MKKILLSIVILFGVFLLTSYSLVRRVNEDVLSTLGLSKTDADKYIVGAAVAGSGYLFKPAAAARIMAMSGTDKAALARNVCAYVKEYCNSNEFKIKYEEYRQSRKPHVQELSDADKKIQQEAIAQQEEMYTPEMLELLPPESRAGLKKSIEDMKASLNGELTDEQKAKWEEEVPANPYVGIKKGLKNFLDDSKDVDYAAMTVMKSSKKIFTNPSYEQKPGLWKACYRAGKDVSEVGRNFAREWLAELK
jgi:hypothetical protein